MSWIALALGTLVSEDLACIAAGVLIAQGKLSAFEGIGGCALGIFLGDLLLFLIGRCAGEAALKWRPLARAVSHERVQRAAEWVQEKGLGVVLASRFTPGLRLPTYLAAGFLRVRPVPFASRLALASVVWTPLLVGAAFLLGEPLLRTVFSAHGTIAFIPVFALVSLSSWQIKRRWSWEAWRRAVGFVKRKLRWEFWPAWAIYLPIAPYLLFLAARHRSLTVFMAANPGIPTGGFVGESKAEILRHLNAAPDLVADFIVLRSTNPHRLQQARGWIDVFPVVLKPDKGERGAGVAIVRTDAEVEKYLASATGDVVVQRYVSGPEYSVFYYRYPDEPKGRIFSITAKHFPTVTGTGRHPLRELILRDPRAVCMASTYERLTRHDLDAIPGAGCQVQLVEIGSHCRGAVFFDATALKTARLEEAVERLSRTHPGFYFGRFDVRAKSEEAFLAGQFRAVELNGVSAEATHVYDPRVTLLDAYRAMRHIWKTAFAIGAIQQARGIRPSSLAELWRAVRGR